MIRFARVAVIVGLLAAVAATLTLKSAGRDSAAPAPTLPNSGLPRVLDLGATQCVPCKAMAPILEDLKKEYAGRLQVDFIDVWADEAVGERYQIEGIPTQKFFDPSGKERFRHHGYMSKQDILAKCKELGFGVP